MRRFLKKHRNSRWIKPAVFFASLVVSLAALEMGLRLAGFVFTSSRDRFFVPPYDEGYHDTPTFERYRRNRRHTRLILTFGDSLTNGGNVKSYQNYPYYLFKHFTDAGKSAAVYNMAYCEDSTFGVASKLGAYFKSQSALPDAVVILVGAADLFNLAWVKERMMRDDSFWRDVMPHGWVYQLRIYKMFRYIKMVLSLRRGAKSGRIEPATAEMKFEKLLAAYWENKKNFGSGKPGGLSPELAKELAPHFKEDMRDSETELTNPVDLMDMLALYGSMVYTRKLRYDEFFGLLLDLAETYPEEFWYNHSDEASYEFFQVYQVQSKYAAADIAKVLDKTAAAHPRVAGRESYKIFRRLLADREAMDRYVDRRRMRAWDEIVRLCREKGVKIVLQNYPVEYQSANRVIAAVAAKHGLSVVDNRKLFSGLIEKAGREKYFEDNDHLTPAGYQILAGHVSKKLVEEGLFAR